MEDMSFLEWLRAVNHTRKYTNKETRLCLYNIYLHSMPNTFSNIW